MKQLQRELNRWLGNGRPRAVDHQARERAAFRRLAAKTGLAFVKSSDGYLEAPATGQFPLGIAFAHHGWPESLDRLRAILADPGLLDAHGYFSE
jgi:hypothetical protein